MTLNPSSDFGIRGRAGKPHAVNPVCAAPGCTRASIHAHHLWPRSYLRGQPYDWVELPDGTVIANRIGLCLAHHEDVTGAVGGHRARINFGSGMFWWFIRGGDGWVLVGALDPQPPGARAQEPPSAPESGPEEVCPTCGKPKHARPHKPSARRKTGTWTLVVPDDAEIGANILDDWADDIAEILGFTEQTSRLRRYHAVAVALAYVMQTRHDFIESIREASEA